jgi:hypothetical protein
MERDALEFDLFATTRGPGNPDPFQSRLACVPVQTNTSNVKTTSGKDKRQRSLAVDGPPPTGVQLYVRLWSGDGSEDPKVPAPARDMIADLLSISGCVMREEGPGLYSANFQDAVQAVRAARHLQRMIRGFCSGTEPGCVNGCVALANAEEPEPTLDLSLLHQTQVLQPAQPGQILLVGALCESARLIPGLQFHPLSGGVVAPDRSRRPRQVLHLLPPASGQASGPDAADQPIQYRITATGSRKRVTTAEIVAQSAARTPTAEAPLIAHRKGDAAVSTGYGRDEEGARKKKVQTLWIAAGGVAAAAIVAGVVFLGSSHKAAAPAAATPVAGPKVVEAPAAATPPAVQPPATVPAVPPTRVDPPPPPHVAPPVAPAAASADGTDVPKPLTAKQKREQERAEAREKKKAAAEEADGDPKPPSGASLISPAEIPSLLASAEKDAGDGNYARAILKYKSILKSQPSNAAAKEGLRRAMSNRDSQ